MSAGGYVDFSGSELRYCWYTRDHLGSVRAVADADGNVIASYAYGPYGEDFAADRFAKKHWSNEKISDYRRKNVIQHGMELGYNWNEL
jgi:hypothetical protein